MNTDHQHEIESFFNNEIATLNLKSLAIKKACKRFELSKEEAEVIYTEVRKGMKKQLSNRAWTYLLIGGIFFGVGVFGTVAKTGFIFYGAILSGFALLLTAIGYFRLALIKS